MSPAPAQKFSASRSCAPASARIRPSNARLNSSGEAVVLWVRAKIDRTVAIYVEVDRYAGVPSYESWWDVPIAEVARAESVRAVRAEYDEARQAERTYL